MERLSPVHRSLLLCFLAITSLVGRSDAQNLMNMTSSLPTQQATNATVVVSIIAIPPARLAASTWIVQWIFDGVFIGQITYHLSTGKTLPIKANTDFLRAEISASAPSGGNNQFSTSFTLNELQLNDTGKNITVTASSGYSTPPPTPQHFSLLVKSCSPTISSSPNVTVETTSYVYNAQGKFKCSNNGELFYSNGTRPSSSNTSCLASATWSGQDNLQCWSEFCSISSIPRLSVEVCLANPDQAGSAITEGETIKVKSCPLSRCNPPLFETCGANGWEGGPFSCIPETDCFNGGDTAITVIFGLLILLCMGYDAWFVFACTHDHPGEWHAQDKIALITALVGLISFLGLLIGYSANYQHKASCFSSGEYHILTSRDLGEVIAGCLIFYLGFYITMFKLYPKHKSDGEKDGGHERDSAPGFSFIEKRAEATPGNNSVELLSYRK